MHRIDETERTKEDWERNFFDALHSLGTSLLSVVERWIASQQNEPVGLSHFIVTCQYQQCRREWKRNKKNCKCHLTLCHSGEIASAKNLSFILLVLVFQLLCYVLFSFVRFENAEATNSNRIWAKRRQKTKKSTHMQLQGESHERGKWIDKCR